MLKIHCRFSYHRHIGDGVGRLGQGMRVHCADLLDEKFKNRESFARSWNIELVVLLLHQKTSILLVHFGGTGTIKKVNCSGRQKALHAGWTAR